MEFAVQRSERRVAGAKIIVQELRPEFSGARAFRRNQAVFRWRGKNFSGKPEMKPAIRRNRGIVTVLVAAIR
jgi:hypothetical protein